VGPGEPKLGEYDETFNDERQQVANKMLRFLDSAENIAAFRGRTAAEVFGTEDSRRQFILQLTPEEYIDLLAGANGIFRGLRRKDWKLYEGHVVIGDPEHPKWDFPEPEDKFALITTSLAAAQQMVQDGRSMIDVGLELSAALTEIHAFNDGNGRTSTLVLTLVSCGYRPEMKNTYTDTVGSVDSYSFAVNTSVLDVPIINITEGMEIGFRDQSGAVQMKNWHEGQFGFSGNVSVDRQMLFVRAMRGNMYYAIEALCGYFEQERVEDCRDSDGFIDMGALTRQLDDRAIDIIMIRWKELKKQHVEMVIDCIAHPEKDIYGYWVPDGQGGTEDITLLDHYKRCIKKRAEELSVGGGYSAIVDQL